MSGGSMNYLYGMVQDAAFREVWGALRKAIAALNPPTSGGGT